MSPRWSVVSAPNRATALRDHGRIVSSWTDRGEALEAAEALNRAEWQRTALETLERAPVRSLDVDERPTCVQCGKPYDHGCNSDFCSAACDDAYEGAPDDGSAFEADDLADEARSIFADPLDVWSRP
jgi:hypothetical protein